APTCDHLSVVGARTCVEDPQVVALLDALQAADLVESARSAGIALRGDDDSDGGARVPGRLLPGEAALRGGEEERERIGAQLEEDGLRLGVAEAAVEFQDTQALGGEHQPCVER